MRDLKRSVPSDRVAATKATYTPDALAYMKRILRADTTPSTELDLAELRQDLVDAE